MGQLHLKVLHLGLLGVQLHGQLQPGLGLFVESGLQVLEVRLVLPHHLVKLLLLRGELVLQSPNLFLLLPQLLNRDLLRAGLWLQILSHHHLRKFVDRLILLNFLFT